MHRPVGLSDAIEPSVQFIEETDGSRILEATLAKLRKGVSVKKILAASALRLTRSSDLPSGHHGGHCTRSSGFTPCTTRSTECRVSRRICDNTR